MQIVTSASQNICHTTGLKTRLTKALRQQELTPRGHNKEVPKRILNLNFK